VSFLVSGHTVIAGQVAHAPSNLPQTLAQARAPAATQTCP
jgi:hypothetical protein